MRKMHNVLSAATVLAAMPAAFANAAPKASDTPNTGAPAGNTTGAKAVTKRTEPEITAIAAIPLPVNVKAARGSKSPYPFDTLEVGKAFGIKNKTAKQLSSIVSNQNRKDSNHRQVKDSNGNVVYKMTEMKDQNGNVTKVPTNEAETEQIKEFRAYDVNEEIAKSIKGTPLEGSSVIVYRVK